MSEKRKKLYGYSEMTEKKKIGSNLLLALTGFVFLSCFAVVFVLHFRWLYYADVEYLGLSELTGLSSSVIRENYDVLIDYNLVLSGMKELNFPSFPMSENGAIHFAEVRRIFFGIQYLAVFSGVCFWIGFFQKKKKQDYIFLKLLSILTVILPTILGVLAYVWWDAFFEIFHKIFFRNDYWLFDPMTDPVIWILPDRFFGHCAAAVLFLILLGGGMAVMLYRKLKKISGN